MFEPGSKARHLLRAARALVAVQKMTKPGAVVRAAPPKPKLVKVERRRKKNKREKASRRRTRTITLYDDQRSRALIHNLVLLIYL